MHPWIFEAQQVWLKTNKCQNLAFILLFLRPAEAKLAKDRQQQQIHGFGKIKTCLVLNWVIRLRPKFTTFRSLTSSVVPQKIGSTALLLFQKFPEDWLGLIKDCRTNRPFLAASYWVSLASPHKIVVIV